MDRALRDLQKGYVQLMRARDKAQRKLDNIIYSRNRHGKECKSRLSWNAQAMKFHLSNSPGQMPWALPRTFSWTVWSNT